MSNLQNSVGRQNAVVCKSVFRSLSKRTNAPSGKPVFRKLSTGMGVLAAVAVATSLSACRHAASSTVSTAIPASTAETPIGHPFGDSVTHSVRVLSLNTKTETADVYVGRPDNTIVLAVEPGRDIELIFPGAMTVKQLSDNRFQFFMQRFELVKSEPKPADASASRRSYEACTKARAAAQRAERTRQASRRDSSGRVAGGEPPSAQKDNFVCDMTPESLAKPSWSQNRLPPRPARERYLVVLSSSQPISYADLNQRLSTMTAVAPNVALTMEAIASGIYAGTSGTWGGTYVSW
ncbi:MAG: hypothetical protein ABJB66_05805 [Gemmatimonadaceae bacterium]